MNIFMKIPSIFSFIISDFKPASYNELLGALHGRHFSIGIENAHRHEIISRKAEYDKKLHQDR